MRFYANIGGRQRTVDVESLGGSQFRVAIDSGAVHFVDAERVEGQTMSLLIDSKSYDVDLDDDGDALHVLVDDEVFTLEVLDERALKLKAASSAFAVSGPQIVKAPMPGKVVKVLVKEGDDVTADQPVVIIEAMKMENELRSPAAGKVTKVSVREGQTVEGRAELVSIG